MRDGVEGAEDFHWFGIAGAAGLGDDDVVEGGMAFGKPGEADFDNHCRTGVVGEGREGYVVVFV